jgi:hypothetical protein
MVAALEQGFCSTGANHCRNHFDLRAGRKVPLKDTDGKRRLRGHPQVEPAVLVPQFFSLLPHQGTKTPLLFAAQQDSATEIVQPVIYLSTF